MASKRKRSNGESNDDDADSALTSPSFEPQLSFKEEPAEIKIHERYGPYVCSFYLPKNRLRYLSTFFEETLAADPQKAVSLYGISPRPFSLFAAFVASGKMNHQLAVLSAEAAGEPEQETRGGEWRLLCRAWRLGYMLQSATFQDIILDAMAQRIARKGVYSSYLHKAVYAEIPPRVRTTPSHRFAGEIDLISPLTRYSGAHDEDFRTSVCPHNGDLFSLRSRVDWNPNGLKLFRQLIIDIARTYKSAVAFSGLDRSLEVAAFLKDVIQAEARRSVGARAIPIPVEMLQEPGCRFHQHSPINPRACYKKIFQSWSQE